MNYRFLAPLFLSFIGACTNNNSNLHSSPTDASPQESICGYTFEKLDADTSNQLIEKLSGKWMECNAERSDGVCDGWLTNSSAEETSLERLRKSGMIFALQSLIGPVTIYSSSQRQITRISDADYDTLSIGTPITNPAYPNEKIYPIEFRDSTEERSSFSSCQNRFIYFSQNESDDIVYVSQSFTQSGGQPQPSVSDFLKERPDFARSMTRMKRF